MKVDFYFETFTLKMKACFYFDTASVCKVS